MECSGGQLKRQLVDAQPAQQRLEVVFNQPTVPLGGAKLLVLVGMLGEVALCELAHRRQAAHPRLVRSRILAPRNKAAEVLGLVPRLVDREGAKRSDRDAVVAAGQAVLKDEDA